MTQKPDSSLLGIFASKALNSSSSGLGAEKNGKIGAAGKSVFAKDLALFAGGHSARKLKADDAGDGAETIIQQDAGESNRFFLDEQTLIALEKGGHYPDRDAAVSEAPSTLATAHTETTSIVSERTDDIPLSDDIELAADSVSDGRKQTQDTAVSAQNSANIATNTLKPAKDTTAGRQSSQDNSSASPRDDQIAPAADTVPVEIGSDDLPTSASTTPAIASNKAPVTVGPNAQPVEHDSSAAVQTVNSNKNLLSEPAVQHAGITTHSAQPAQAIKSTGNAAPNKKIAAETQTAASTAKQAHSVARQAMSASANNNQQLSQMAGTARGRSDAGQATSTRRQNSVASTSKFAQSKAAIEPHEDSSVSLSAARANASLRASIAEPSSPLSTSMSSSASGANPNALINNNQALQDSTFSETMEAAATSTDMPTLDAPLDSAEFGQQLSDRVILAIREQLETAEIQVSPDELGPIRIELQMDGDEASVNFIASNPDTREALQDSLRDLAQRFEDEGMNLANTDISDGRGEQSANDEGQSRSSGGDNLARSDRDWGGQQVDKDRAQSKPAGIVDLFA